MIKRTAGERMRDVTNKRDFDPQWIAIGAAFGLISGMMGAGGIHFFESRLTLESLDILYIGVKYQMYHALALLVLGTLSNNSDDVLLNLSGWLFTTGIILFSGSLYMLSFTGYHLLGAITPFGGLALFAGWTCLMFFAIRQRHPYKKHVS